MALINDGSAEILSRDDGKLLSQATAGTSHTVPLNQPSVVKIHGTRAMVNQFDRQGNDLVLHMHDGSVVRYQKFFLDDVDGDHSELVFDDGVNPAEHALFPVTSELGDLQTAVAMTPQYESLGAIDTLLLADTGATSGVMTAAGIGALGLAGLGIGALASGGGGGGGGGSNSGTTPGGTDGTTPGDGTTTPGGGTTPITPTLTIDPFTGDAILSPSEKTSVQTVTGSTTNAEAGSLVTLVLNGKTYTASVDAEGHWSISLPTADLAALPDGANTLSASVTNNEGNSASASENITVESSATVPAAPGITIATFAGDDVLDGAEKEMSQTLSGTTTNVQQGQTVTVTLGGQTYTTTVGADGSWSLSVPSAALEALADGSETIGASVTNAAGVTASASHDFTVLSSSLASISIDVVSEDGYLSVAEAQAPLVVTGTSTGLAAGTVINVTVDPQPANTFLRILLVANPVDSRTYSATINADGTWSVTLPPEHLQQFSVGTHLFNASAMAADGTMVQNSTPATLDVRNVMPDATPEQPFGDDVLNASEASAGQTITGNTGVAASGQTVTLTLGGVSYTGTVNSDGSWSLTLPAAILQNLPQGTNDITVVVTDPAGNSATTITPFDVMTVPPVLSVTLPDGPLNQSEVTQPLTISGSSPGSDTVTVTLNGLTYTSTVNADGSFSVNIPASDLQQIADGDATIGITATDLAGNATAQTGTISIDTLPPTVSVDTISGDGYVNAGELALPLQISGVTEPGSQVLVRLDGLDLTATVNAQTGAWSVTLSDTDKAAIADGTYTVTVIATDPAGNSSTTYTDVTFATQFGNLPALTLNPLTGDGVLDGAEVAVNQELTGTASHVQAGQQITLVLAGGDTFTGTVQAGGGWSITLPSTVLSALAEGTQSFTVSVSDVAGNGTTASGSFVVATDSSVATLAFAPVSGDNALNATEAQSDLVVSGSSTGLAEGTALTVTFNGVDYATTVAAGGGWSATLPASALDSLANGTYTLVVTGVDAGNNPVTSESDLLVRTQISNNIEIVAPFGDGILNASEAAVPQTLTGNSGVAWPDQAVSVTIGGISYPATVNASTGAWSLTLTPDVLQALAEGSQEITVTVTDSLGNSLSSVTPLTVDTAPPALAITAVGDNSVINGETHNLPLTVSGTAEAGSTLVVELDGVSYRTVADGNGQWSVDIAASTLQTLPDGKYDISVTATDAGGNIATALAPIAVDTVPPAVTLAVISGDGYLNAAEHADDLLLNGTAEVGSTVVVSLNGVSYEATTDGSGNWTLTVPAAAVSVLADGRYDITAQATDAAGNVATATQPLAVVAEAADLPTISVSAFTGDNVLDGAEQGLSQPMTGATTHVQEGQQVRVTMNGDQYTGTVQADGSWSVLIPASAFVQLANGAQNYTVDVTDIAGNPASTSGSYSVDNTFSAVAIGVISDDNMLNAVEAQSDLVISGSSRFVSTGARILVRFNSVNYTTLTESDGSWSVTVPASALTGLPNGNLTVTATTTDINGNEITTTHNLNSSVNPDFTLTLDTPFADGSLNAAEAGIDQTLTGTTGVTGIGQAVSLVVGGITYNGTVDANGNWSVSLPGVALQTLPEGSTALSVTATDSAGNTTTLTSSFIVDTIPPVLTVAAISEDYQLNLAEQGQPLAISGTGEQGDTISLTLNGETLTGTVSATGSWDITVSPAALLALADGSYDVVVTSTDAAGNATTLIRTLVVDLTPPVVTINAASEDGYLNAAEGTQPLVVNGTGEAGNTISVELNNVAYSAVVAPNGQWALTIPGEVVNALNDGSYTLNFTASDAAGNTTLTSTPLVVDKSAPSIFISDVTANNVIDSAEQQVDQILTGTATNVEAGQTLTLTLNGQDYTTTIETGGGWQVTLPAAALALLANGQQTLSATVTDLAGNTGLSEKTFSVDNTLSSIAFEPLSGDGYLNAVEAESALTVNGVTANVAGGSTVTFTLGGVSYTSAVNADGSWSVTVPAADLAGLADGPQTAIASVTASSGITYTSQDTLDVYITRVPSPTLQTPFTDGTLTHNEADIIQTLNGTTGELGNGQTVSVNLGGTDYAATVNSSGVWTLALDPQILQALPQGQTTLVVTVTDVAGNTAALPPAAVIIATTLPAVTLDPLAGGDGIINAAEQASPLDISGTGSVGDTVNVLLNGQQYTTVVEDTGRWAVTVPAADLALLDDGPYGVQVTVSDAFGNTTSQTLPLAVDTSAPAFTLDPVTGDNIIDQAEQGQPLDITGTGSAGDTVAVTLAGDTFTTTVGSNGLWAVNVPAATLANLTEGDNTLTVAVTSVAGNAATQDTTLLLDTTVDITLIVNTVAGDDVINAAEAAQGITVTGSVPDETTAVTLTFNGVNYTAAVGANGLWTAAIPASALAGLTDGDYALTATATAANGGSVTVPHAIALDTTPPTFTLAPLAGDGVINATEQGQPLVVSGTGEVGDSVRVTLNEAVYTTTVNADGSWSLPVPEAQVAGLTNGLYTVDVTVNDAAGNITTQSTPLIVDLTPPLLTIDPVAGDGLLNAEEQTLPLTVSGMGEQNATITVTLEGTDYTTTVGANGQWALAIPAADLAGLTNGNYQLTVVATSAVGNVTTGEAPLTVVADAATLPTLSLDEFAGNNILDGAEQQVDQLITGTTTFVQEGQSVTVTFNDVNYSGLVQASGAWSVLIPAAALADLQNGSQTYSVTVGDIAGNVVTAVGNYAVNTALSAVAIEPVSGDGYLNAAEAQGDLTIFGATSNVPAGSTLTVTLNGTDYQTEVAANGSWQVVVPSAVLLALPDGALAVTASATDAAGNTVTSDTTLNIAITTVPTLTIDTPFTDGTLNAEEAATTQTLTGSTGETGDGQTVSVVINGVTLTGTVDGNGNWSVDLPGNVLQELPQGTTPATVTVSDVAGNTATTELTLTVDTLPPAVTLAALAGDNILNAAEQGNDLAVSGTSESGAAIVVTLNGVTYTTTVTPAGEWTLTIPTADLVALADGSYAVSVSATSAAGNSSTTETTLAVKAAANDLPTLTIDAFAGNDIVDGAEQQTDQLLSGTATNVEPGQTLTVSLNGQVYTTQIAASGAWSVAIPASALAALDNGTATFNVAVSDVAGNPVNVTHDVTVNNLAAGIAIDPLSGDGYLNAAEAQDALIVSGVTENVTAGSTVTVTFNNQTFTGEVGANGVWSIIIPAASLAGLPDGAAALTASVVDATGATLTRSDTLIVQVNALPLATADTPFDDGILNGSEAAVTQTLHGTTGVTGDGQVVSVVVGDTAFTGTVDSNGNWSVVVPSTALQALPQGDNALQVTVADAAGNSNTLAVPFGVDTVPPTLTLNTLAGDGVVNASEAAAEITVSGGSAGAEAGQLITVSLNGQNYTTTVDDVGNWSLQLPAGLLQASPDGSYPLVVTLSDAAGNTVSETSDLTLSTAALQPEIANPFVNGYVNIATSQSDQLLSGTTGADGAGQTVVVNIAGTDYAANVDNAGNWTLPVSAATLQALGEGIQLITVTATDAQGNTGVADSSITVDLIAPALNVNAIAGDNIINAAEMVQPISIGGTASVSEAGQQVSISFNGQTYQQAVQGDGSWLLDLPSGVTLGLADGSYPVIVTLTDLAGNVTTQTLNVTVDAATADLPTLTVGTVSGDDYINQAEAGQDLTLSGTTTNVPEGQTVTLTLNAVTYTATVQADGTWTTVVPAAAVGALADGAQTLSASVSDIAGNVASATHDVTVIAQAADLPTLTINPVTSDDTVNYQEAQSDVTLTGTSQHIPAGDTVTVTMNGKTYTGTVDADGAWSATVPAADVQALGQGGNSVTASGSDVAGNIATSTENFTVNTTPPLLDARLDAGTDGVLNLAEAVAGLPVSGTTGAGLTVSVTLNDKLYSATSDADGNWNLTIPGSDLLQLADGQAQVGVSVTDTSGNTTSNILALGVAVNTLPLLTLATPFVDGLVNAAEAATDQTLSGVATNLVEGTAVTVTIGTLTFNGTVNADGSWSATVPADALTALGDGAFQVAVTSADAAGNPASVGASVELLVNTLPAATINTPFIDGLLNAAEAGVDQAITGTTGIVGNGQTVTLTIDDNSITATVDQSGNWQATLTPTLAATLGNGDHTISVTVTDRAGNASTDELGFSEIVTGLPAPTLITPFTDGLLNATEAAAGGALNGVTGITGPQTVSVIINGTAYQAAVDTTTGDWSLDLPASVLVTLPDGNWPVSIVATDAVGNVGTVSGGLVVDINALPDVSIQLPFGDGQLNVAEAAVAQTLSGSTGKIATGQSVTVSIDGGTALAADVSANGDWSLTLTPAQLTALGSGTHSLAVTATDIAGNTDTADLNFNALLSLPAPVIDTPFGDGVLNISEAGAAIVLTGSTGVVGANQGAQIHIDVGGLVWNGTVDAEGNWSVSLPAGALNALGNGTHTLDLTVTDGAGNTSTTSLDFTAALTAPVPTLDVPFADSFLNAAEVAAGATLTGTTGATGDGQTVTVTLGGTNYTAAVGTDGTWTLDLASDSLTELAEGNQAITVLATDVNGNAATATGSFVVDTVAPAITINPFTGDGTLDYLESLTTQTLSGTTSGSSTGEVVTVTVGTATVSGYVQADGSWSVSLSPAILAQLGTTGDTGTIGVTVADAAGNTGTATASVAVDLTVPEAPLLTLAPLSDDNIINGSDAATLTISGTYANLPSTGGEVSVTINGVQQTETSAVVDANGTWSITVPNDATNIPEGTLTVTASLTTDDGTTYNSTTSVLVDRTAPTLTINAFAGDDVLNVSEAALGQTVTGTASASEAGRAVDLTLNGKTYSAVVQADGSWSVALAAGDLQALGQAGNTLAVSLTDAAGNVGSATHDFQVDTAAPLIQVDALLGTNVLNAADILATQVVTGTASGAAGQTIGLYLGDSSPLATALVNADGTFSISLAPEVLSSLNDGALVFGLRVSDAAGNETDATLTVNKVVNAGLTLVVDSLFGDGFLNAADTTVAQTISGVATAAGIGATVSLTLGGTTVTADVGQDGRFALVVPPSLLGLLSDGPTTLDLVLTDAAGNTRTLPETITTLLEAPVLTPLTGLFGGDNLLNIAEAAVAQTVTGTVSNAVAGSAVTVMLGTKAYQTTVGTDGGWSVTIPVPDLSSLAEGTQSLSVRVVDPAGNATTSAVDIGIFTAQPAITLSPIFGDGILNIADALVNQTISGTVSNAAAGSTIILTIGNSSVQATVGQNGAFSATVTPAILATLTDGNLTVGASLTDAAGNTASTTAGLAVKLTAPTVSINTLFGDGLLNLADAALGQTVTGTVTGADAGSRVVVTLAGTPYVTTTAANGTFSLALTPSVLQGLADGNLTAAVSVTDSAGNTANATAGAVVGVHNLPTVTLNTLFGDGVLNLLESLTTQTISGTVNNVAAGSTVTINLGNSTVTATVAQGGTFTAQVSPAILSTLLDGNLTVGVSVSDAVGNIATASSGVKVGTHTTPALTLNTIFGDGVLSAADLTTAQTISGTASNVPAGAAVSVTLSGITYTTTVSSAGTWTLNVPKADLAALANGTQTVNATVSDSYGNTATGSGSLSVIAQTPPTVVIASIFGDGLLNATDALSAQTITGTTTNAEGSTLTVRVGSATLTTTVGANGAWSVTVPVATLAALPDGTDTVTASLTNAAGNAGTASSSVLVGIHTLPTVTLTNSSVFGGDHYLNLSEANVAETLSGTSTNAVGSTVSVNVAGNIYTTTVGAGGAWSVSIPSGDLRNIADGSQTVTVTLTDAVGNTSSANESFTAVTHNLPYIGVNAVTTLVSVLINGLTISGGTQNLAQGTQLNVTLNGTTLQTTTDARGLYSVKFAGGLLTALSLSSIVTVTAVDVAGNPASTSTTLLLGSLLPVAAASTSAATLLAVMADDSTSDTSTTHSASTTSEDSTTAAAHTTVAHSTLVTDSDTSSTDSSTATSAAATTGSAEESTTSITAAADDSSYTIGGVVITLADGTTAEGASVTGSSGDDTVTVSSLNFTHIDGGAGTDTLVLGGEHMTLDLTSLGMKVEHIEIIDLGKAGNNTVKLNLSEALNITDSQTDDLLIKGVEGDKVQLANGDGGVWATAGQRTVDGQVYDIYHNSALDAANTLGDVLVQHALQVVVA